MLSEIARPAAPRLRRLAIYIDRMWPLQVRVPANLALMLTIYLGLQAIHDTGKLSFSWRALVGVVSVQLLMLLVRVYDEFKDLDSDLEFARSGDPRFVNRPLVTGEVTLDDVTLLLRLATAALFLLNLPLGWPLPGLGFLGAFGYLWLSSKWFFVPRMKGNLLLAFATHLPNVLVIELYVVGLYAAEFGGGLAVLPTSALVLAVMAQAGAWETSSKIRSAEEETPYQTYSKIFGARAVWLPIGFLALSAGGYAFVFEVAGLGRAPIIALLGAASLAIGGCLRFLAAPSPAHSNVRPLVEIYWFVSSLSFLVGAIASRGITFGDVG